MTISVGLILEPDPIYLHTRTTFALLITARLPLDLEPSQSYAVVLLLDARLTDPASLRFLGLLNCCSVLAIISDGYQSPRNSISFSLGCGNVWSRLHWRDLCVVYQMFRRRRPWWCCLSRRRRDPYNINSIGWRIGGADDISFRDVIV